MMAFFLRASNSSLFSSQALTNCSTTGAGPEDIRVDRDDFYQLLQDTYDDNGRLAQHQSVVGAQTKALTQVMVSIEEELQEARLDIEELNTVLERKEEQYEANYNELLSTSSGDEAALKAKFAQVAGQIRDAQEAARRAERQRDAHSAELAELREAAAHGLMPERQRQAFDRLQADYDALKTEHNVLQLDRDAMLAEANAEIQGLSQMLQERTAQLEEVVAELETYTGSDAATLQARLKTAYEAMQRRERELLDQLRDAQDDRASSRLNRSRPSSETSYLSAGGDLGSELAKALEGSPHRPPSSWNVPTAKRRSRKGRLPRSASSHSDEGRPASVYSTHSTHSASTKSTKSTKSQHSDGGTTIAVADAQITSAHVDPSDAARAAHNKDMAKKNDQIERLLSEMSGLREKLNQEAAAVVNEAHDFTHETLQETLSTYSSAEALSRRSSRGDSDSGEEHRPGTTKANKESPRTTPATTGGSELTGKVTVVVEREVVRRSHTVNSALAETPRVMGTDSSSHRLKCTLLRDPSKRWIAGRGAPRTIKRLPTRTTEWLARLQRSSCWTRSGSRWPSFSPAARTKPANSSGAFSGR